MNTENFKKYSKHLYLLKNQNGIYKALDDALCLDIYELKYRKEIYKMLKNLPKSYPCLIDLNIDDYENDKIYIKEINADEIQLDLLKLLINRK